MVVLIPVPVVVTIPGRRVNVHIPVAGKLLNITLPVNTAHVGCVIVPTTGEPGVMDGALMTISADKTEVQPAELVTE